MGTEAVAHVFRIESFRGVFYKRFFWLKSSCTISNCKKSKIFDDYIKPISFSTRISSFIKLSTMGTLVYLGGLSHRARERDVEKFFRKFGRIKDISLKNGFAFVDFEDYRDADDACYELSGKDFLGERVTVELARGTPHGRDRERWGDGRRGGRDDRGGD